MTPAAAKLCHPHCRRAFTLVELMVAMSIGVIVAGTVVLLLIQAATEQQRGYSDSTIEERAYTLQANITSCLRGMSSGFGMTAGYSNTFLIGNKWSIASHLDGKASLYTGNIVGCVLF